MDTNEPPKFNIYCDESSIDNPNHNWMVIGALFIDRTIIPNIKDRIKEIREKHSINGELKWVKSSARTTDFYEELFAYLFSFEPQKITFRCIAIDKSKINYEKYHQQDKELAFYKFYYQLLKRRIKEDVQQYLFLDFRPSKNKNSVRRLGEFLNLFTKGIKHIQAYPSDQNIFIQVTDILTGAVAYSYNSTQQNKSKNALISSIAKSISKENLHFCSPFWEEKFNIFCIDLTKRN